MDDAARSLAATIDHTLLRPEATRDDVRRLCEEAVRLGFAAVCVNPCRVAEARRWTDRSEVAVATVCGFPLGASRSAVKAAEAARGADEGATEVDMVIAVGAVKDGDWAAVVADIAAVVAAAGEAAVKVILECGLLDDAEKRTAAVAAVDGGAAFVKTSTGFLAGGATVEDVALLKRAVAGRARVKASGGIRTLGRARAMLAAGADRLGTSSGVAIMEELAGRG